MLKALYLILTSVVYGDLFELGPQYIRGALNMQKAAQGGDSGCAKGCARAAVSDPHAIINEHCTPNPP